MTSVPVCWVNVLCDLYESVSVGVFITFLPTVVLFVLVFYLNGSPFSVNVRPAIGIHGSTLQSIHRLKQSAAQCFPDVQHHESFGKSHQIYCEPLSGEALFSCT